MTKLTVLLEKTNQAPYINRNSNVLLFGQNPPAWYAKSNWSHERYPFNFNPDEDWNWHKQNRRGSPLYAADIVFTIKEITGEFPSFANLVTCVTEENRIDAYLLNNYGFKVDPPLLDIKIIFCFGTMTYHLVHQQYTHSDLGSPMVIKLKHPSFMTRFHRHDADAREEQKDILLEALYDIM